MKKYLQIFFLAPVISFVTVANAQNQYRTIADGNWSASGTWSSVSPYDGVPPAVIPANATVEILNRVIYNVGSDLEINGSLFIGTIPGGAGDTLRFPNNAGDGVGKSIIIKSTGFMGVYNGGLIMPIFLSNGTSNNSGNVKVEGGRTEYIGSLAEVAQNWQSAGSGSRRKFLNSCLRAGENYINEGIDTVVGVCIEVGAHGSTNFENKGTLRTRSTSVLWQGTSGSFINSSILETLGGVGVGLQAIRVIGGNVQNSGTWNASVNFWCATSGSTGTFNPALPAQNCGFFTANNNFLSRCRDCSPNNAPLPVDMQSFTANRSRSNVLLKWETASEQHNSGFAIERKGTGDWEQVGFVPSQAPNGNSTDLLTYQYTDVNTIKGISQYRIRQVDFDGQSKYSQIIAVKGEGQTGKTIVYPNPTSNGKVNIVFESADVSRDAQLVDMTGRVIKQWRGITTNTIQVDNLTPGVYSLRILVPETGEQTIEKIVVNKR